MVTVSKIDFETFSGTSTQWRTWMPTLANHSGTVNVVRYTLVGKTCQFYFKVTLTSGASAAINFTLPVTASSSLQTGSFASALPTIIGYGGMIKNGIGYFQVFPYLYSTTQANLGVVVSNGGAGTYLGYQDSGPSKPATWVMNDQYIISGAYETT